MKRGEVWKVDFGPPSGPEQAGERPAIIMIVPLLHGRFVQRET